jgi:hypothetical protein
MYFIARKTGKHGAIFEQRQAGLKLDLWLKSLYSFGFDVR